MYSRQERSYVLMNYCCLEKKMSKILVMQEKARLCTVVRQRESAFLVEGDEKVLKKIRCRKV